MILIVDDTPTNIDIVMEILGELDEAAVALDGEEALEIVESERPSVILLDILMPGIDGFEVCRRLKLNSETADIPVIFLSGNGSEEERARAEELGAAGFLTKPVDPAALTEAVKTFL